MEARSSLTSRVGREFNLIMTWLARLRRNGLQAMFFFSLCPVSLASTNLSFWVYPGPAVGSLRNRTPSANRILDESGVGYKGGLAPLPSTNVVPVKNHP